VAARTYSYLCHRCGFNTLAGSQVWECPHCGNELELVGVHDVPAHAAADDRRMEIAVDSVIRGLEDLLRRESERDGS
jgi:ribosomal protein L37AE/L43A